MAVALGDSVSDSTGRRATLGSSIEYFERRQKPRKSSDGAPPANFLPLFLRPAKVAYTNSINSEIPLGHFHGYFRLKTKVWVLQGID